MNITVSCDFMLCILEYRYTNVSAEHSVSVYSVKMEAVRSSETLESSTKLYGFTSQDTAIWKDMLQGRSKVDSEVPAKRP
jgi:hypothetical protein